MSGKWKEVENMGKLDDIKEDIEDKIELFKEKTDFVAGKIKNFDKKTVLIVFAFLMTLFVLAFSFLGYMIFRIDSQLTKVSASITELQTDPKKAIQEELQVKEMYELSGQIFLDAFNVVDNALKAEMQAQDRLTSESFIQTFEQAYRGFTTGIQMAEKILKEKQGTFYRDKLAKQGLLIAGNYYSLTQMRENRDVVLQKFMENRGAVIATMTLEECKLIDNAISQYSMEKQPALGTPILWGNIVNFLPPDSRVAGSGGKDIYGHPFVLGNINLKKNEITVPRDTYLKFRDTNFDWGKYGPDQP